MPLVSIRRTVKQGFFRALLGRVCSARSGADQRQSSIPGLALFDHAAALEMLEAHRLLRVASNPSFARDLQDRPVRHKLRQRVANDAAKRSHHQADVWFHA